MMIDHTNGDYFVDVKSISPSFLRAAFGVWIHIYVAVVAFCVRSMYRSGVTARLLSGDSRDRKVSLWAMSPAATPSEVFGLRNILLRALGRGHFSYVMASFFCVIAAVVGAASTTIANHTVVQHPVVRRTDVSGRLAVRDTGSLVGLYDRVAERAQALTRAQAPFNQLFDFMPDDDTNWVFAQEEWNNTWTGECVFQKYSAVNLVVHSTADLLVQNLIPALGTLLPPWATVDPTKQGYAPIFSTQGEATNGTVAWRDYLITYAFGSAPYFPGNESLLTTSTTNISFANVLLHEIGGINGTTFMETAFKSDVHVAECTFSNSFPSEDQAMADQGYYFTTAAAVANVYATSVAESSAQGQNVVQPTAQDMFRYFQAYKMVSHGYFIHPVRRKLSVSLQVVQIRLSVVVATIVTLLLALVGSVVARSREPLDEHGEHINLPKSQLDWIVEAASQHHVEGDYKSHLDYAKERQDLFCTVSTTRTGLSRTQITSNRDKSITQPFLGYFDPHSPYDRWGELATATPGYGYKLTTQTFIHDFDPNSLYDKSRI